MLNRNYIRPLDSHYGIPILFEIKKDGYLRLFVYYKAVNTLVESYSSVIVDKLLSGLQRSMYLPRLDLYGRYSHIPIVG